MDELKIFIIIINIIFVIPVITYIFYKLKTQEQIKNYIKKNKICSKDIKLPQNIWTLKPSKILESMNTKFYLDVLFKINNLPQDDFLKEKYKKLRIATLIFMIYTLSIIIIIPIITFIYIRFFYL